MILESPDFDPSIPQWSWGVFPEDVNRIISGFLEDCSTPNIDTDPEKCTKKADKLTGVIDFLAETITERKLKDPVTHDQLADAFLSLAVLREDDRDLSCGLFGLSIDIRALSADSTSSGKTLIFGIPVTQERITRFLSKRI